MYLLQQQHLLVMVMMLFATNGPTDVDAARSIYAPEHYFKDYYSHTTGSLDFVLEGGEADIPCVPEDENKPKVDEPTYSWSNTTEYKAIYLAYYPQWRIKSDSGLLLVKQAQLNQTGKYYCSLRSRVRKNEPLYYEHNLAVYQLPEYTMKWMIYHLTRRCDDKGRYKNYIKDVLRMLCLGVKECAWTFKYDICIASGADFSKTKWDLMKSWTAGSQNELIVSFEMRLQVAKGYRAPQCDLTCITKNVKSHLELEYKPKLQSFKTMSRDVYRETMDLTFLEKKMTQELALVCPPGYEKYKTEVCIPCFPGRDKKAKSDSMCDPCGYFAYQPGFAASHCRPCPALKLAGKRGAVSRGDCYWYFKNVIFWIIIVLGVILCSGPCCVIGYYYMRWREDETYLWKKCDKWCGFAYQFDTTKQKKYRLFDKDPNALPQIFEAPAATKKKETKVKALPEAWVNSLTGKDKGKAEVKGTKKTDDTGKSKSKDKTKDDKKDKTKKDDKKDKTKKDDKKDKTKQDDKKDKTKQKDEKDKKSSKGNRKSSVKPSKSTSKTAASVEQPPPDSTPPPDFPPPPGFYGPGYDPAFQGYPPPGFYYPPDPFYGQGPYPPGSYPPGPVPNPYGPPPGYMLSPEERAALGLPPAGPGPMPVNLRDFDLDEDDDD